MHTCTPSLTRLNFAASKGCSFSIPNSEMLYAWRCAGAADREAPRQMGDERARARAGTGPVGRDGPHTRTAMPRPLATECGRAVVHSNAPEPRPHLAVHERQLRRRRPGRGAVAIVPRQPRPQRGRAHGRGWRARRGRRCRCRRGHQPQRPGGARPRQRAAEEPSPAGARRRRCAESDCCCDVHRLAALVALVGPPERGATRAFWLRVQLHTPHAAPAHPARVSCC